MGLTFMISSFLCDSRCTSVLHSPKASQEMQSDAATQTVSPSDAAAQTVSLCTAMECVVRPHRAEVHRELVPVLDTVNCHHKPEYV